MAAKRKARHESQPPEDVFYVFKIAALPTRDGSFDMYVGMRDGWIATTVSDVSDAEAMRQLAKHAEGRALRCERRLLRAGKQYGFDAADAPEWAATVRWGLFVCMALGPSMGPDCMLPAGELAKASGKFLKSAPWQYWHSDLGMRFDATGLAERTFEGCIMGSGGSEYGIALYEEQGAVEKLVKLHEMGRQREARAMNCFAVTFDRAPAFAAKALAETIGVPVVPVPMRLEGGKPATLSAAEILLLAAALVASSGLTPSTLVSIGGVSDGRGSVTVKATAPRLGV